MDLSHVEIKSFNDPRIKVLPHTVEMLDMWNNQISSFEHSENLPKSLKILNLGGNKISSFKGCENLPKTLKELNLWYNQISSFEHSEGLPRTLEILDLYGNQISSFEHSECLPRNLNILDLYGNQISSFKHSENLPKNLEALRLDNNQISLFEQLDLGYSQVSSYEILLRYTKFEFGTPLEYIKFFQHYKDSIPILNEIHGSPYLERMKTELEEEERRIKEDPELFYSTI
jgi:Leucine-rich repeat (LRR) protein